MLLILKAILFVLGLLCILVAGWLALRSLRRLFTWCSAVGSVDHVDEFVRGGLTMFFPSVYFQTRDGTEVVLPSKSSAGSSVRKYRIGDPVRVLYDPLMPEHAQIASFMDLWFPVLIAIFVAVVFFSASYQI